MFFNTAITVAKDEQTATAKANYKVTINENNMPPTRRKVGVFQRGKSVGWALSMSLKRTFSEILARK